MRRSLFLAPGKPIDLIALRDFMQKNSDLPFSEVWNKFNKDQNHSNSSRIQGQVQGQRQGQGQGQGLGQEELQRQRVVVSGTVHRNTSILDNISLRATARGPAEDIQSKLGKGKGKGDGDGHGDGHGHGQVRSVRGSRRFLRLSAVCSFLVCSYLLFI
jgi:hypothetical protein